jgi:hypothetical protein
MHWRFATSVEASLLRVARSPRAPHGQSPHREGDPSDVMRGSAEGVWGGFGRCGSWIARYSPSHCGTVGAHSRAVVPQAKQQA